MATSSKAILFILAASPAYATAFLFTSAGALNTGITMGNGSADGSTTVAVMTLQINGRVTMGNTSQIAIEMAKGDLLTMTGSATDTGQVDFADSTSVATGGTCPGGCKVPTVSSSISAGSTITGGTVVGVGLASAISQWTGLSSTSTGWGSVAGASTSLAGGATICTGGYAGGGGCTVNAPTPTTQTVNGVLQTAYVFNLSSATIGGTITVKGDGTALVIFNYSGAGKLTTSAGSKMVLTGGINRDQMLLNDTSNAGIDTSAGFNFQGALAINSATTAINLNAAVIDGRLFLNSTTAATANLSSGTFSLSTVPEPGTTLLIGGALIAIALGCKRLRR